ncbi:hypothetical protein JL722_13962 [Aureococcus anophagefferens]|nr:hypothetical protein JL722_13962 [Aureococcus anophagefferens]
MNASVRRGRARARAARVIRKFANAIARKAAEARGETFVPTPYDETAVDAVVVTAVPPVAPVVAPEPAPPAVSAPAGPPLKALEAMTIKQLHAELDTAGAPKRGKSGIGQTSISTLRDLVRRLRAGEPAASLKVPRKPKSAEELFATLVADGAKKVVFKYDRPGNGKDYLVAAGGLAETDPLRLEFDELAARRRRGGGRRAPVDRLQRVPDPGLVNLPTIWPRMRFPVRVATSGRQATKAFSRVQVDVNDMETLRARARMCYRVIRDAKRRVGGHPPRAEDDQCPAYYGVDYRTAGGKLCAAYTVHEGTKTLREKSAPADPRFEAFSGGGMRGNVLKHPTAVAVYRRDLGVLEALRSLENAFSEFMPERFYGISDDHCPAGKCLARATIPGSGKHAAIVFGLYDSKVEVSIQEKHRISEVVVARFEEVNVARAGAEKPLPPLHVAGASRRLERYKADFALQLKDLAYVEAADEAYLRDQAAALAPPEPMPDGSRPPIDAHSRRTAASTAAVANYYRDPCGLLEPRALAPPGQPRRVAKLYVVPNGEVVSPPPPPIYHVTENGERLLVLYATRVQRPLIPAIQAVHKQRAEPLALRRVGGRDGRAMFDSRPIEIARPLLFESEEDAQRRAEPAAPKRKRKSRKKKRKAAAAAAAAAAERGDEAAPAADGAAEPRPRPRRPPRRPPSRRRRRPSRRPPRRRAGAAPAKKKKKKRSRRRGPAPPAEISEYERTRMRNIAAGNKKLYSLGLIHPPPEVVADPEHSWLFEAIWDQNDLSHADFAPRGDSNAFAGT